MATVNHYGTKVEMTVSLVLPEDQARALKWVVDYGADNMAKFADGSTEGQRHRQALRELVDELRSGLGQTLARADRAREAFKTETIKPECDKCGNELNEAGGLAFSPPQDMPLDAYVIKYHLCRACWVRFARWINQE